MNALYSFAPAGTDRRSARTPPHRHRWPGILRVKGGRLLRSVTGNSCKVWAPQMSRPSARRPSPRLPPSPPWSGSRWRYQRSAWRLRALARGRGGRCGRGGCSRLAGRPCRTPRRARGRSSCSGLERVEAVLRWIENLSLRVRRHLIANEKKRPLGQRDAIWKSEVARSYGRAIDGAYWTHAVAGCARRWPAATFIVQTWEARTS